jgi:hypothetical protein
MSKVRIDKELIYLFLETWNEYTGDNLTYDRINYGWCYQLALVIHGIYGGELVTPGYSHAWVNIDGLDYDSENLRGGNIAKYYDEDDVMPYTRSHFIKVWSTRGNSGDVRLDVVKATINRYKQQLKQRAS